MKRLILVSFVLFILLLRPILIAQGAESGEQFFYQSGDIIKDNDRQILMAANGREIELIEIGGNDKFYKFDEFDTLGEPTRVMAAKVENRNHAVVLGGDKIALYDLGNLNNIILKKRLGPYWSKYDFYYDLSPYVGNKFLTAGKKGIAIWDSNTLDNLEYIYDKKSYGVAGFNYAVYAVTEEGALIMNAERKRTIDSHIKVGEHNHKPFVDAIGVGYFPGDDVVKMRTYTNYKNMANPSGAGNAIDGFPNSRFIYFVNGWEIQKLDKNLKLIRKYSAGNKKGAWMSGIKAARLAQGNRIIVFNGAGGILLLDENLRRLAEYNYIPVYNLNVAQGSLKVSPTHTKPGYPVMVVGRGFWPGENVKLSFADQKYDLFANNIGMAFKMLEAPRVAAKNALIFLQGVKSGYNHIFNFIIDE